MNMFVEEFKNYLYEKLNEELNKSLIAVNSDKNIKWITVKGNHIPIKYGQTADETVKEFLAEKSSKPFEDGLADSIASGITKAIKDTQCNSKEPAEKFPKTIAGVKRDLPMTFYEADKGNCNPSYNSNIYRYSHNCQSCVVVYEARRRGYNVKAAPRKNNDKTAELARHTSWAWIDPRTNEKCDYTYTHTNNAAEHKQYLENTLKQGQRYQYSFEWVDLNNKSHRHVLIAERDNFGDLMIFDPQTSKIFKDRNLDIFLKVHKNPRILRIDDKFFNPYFMNDVVEKF